MSIESFNNNGYVLIKNYLSRELIDFITQYALFDEMQNFSNDTQVPNAHSKYADPAMETLLIKIQNSVELETGKKLYPTYSFYRVYRTGDSLPSHIDRESCEISVTMCLNYSYDSEEYYWPIKIGNEEITMYPGDMVIYKGTEIEHSRDYFSPPSINDWHIQSFLHYVDSNGPFSNFIFDKRSGIGEKKEKNIKKPYVYYV